MTTNMILRIPKTLINPNLEEIQTHFASVLGNVVDLAKEITMWGQRLLNKKDTRRKVALRFEEEAQGEGD